MPEALQAARGSAGTVLRARPTGRPHRADHVRPLLGLLHRPDREEAAQPLPARHAGALVRDGGVQSHLQVLPELGHLEGARLRPPAGSRLAGGDRAGRGGLRLPIGGVHLQRPGDLPRVRGRRGPGLPRAGHQDGRGQRRVHLRRAAGRVLRPHGRRQYRPEGLHRALLQGAVLCPPRPGARNARVSQARDQRLVRDHDLADPRAERFTPRSRP